MFPLATTTKVLGAKAYAKRKFGKPELSKRGELQTAQFKRWPQILATYASVEHPCVVRSHSTGTMSQAIKDFISGMGQVLDLGSTKAPRLDASSFEADGRALRGDWSAVGCDLKNAARKSNGR